MTPTPSAQTVTADDLEHIRSALVTLSDPLTITVDGHLTGTVRALAIVHAMRDIAATAALRLPTLTTSLAAASARIGELTAGEKALRGELWQLRQIVTDIRVLNNAGQFKQFEGEPWLRRACNIDLHHDPAATDVAFRSALSQTEEGR